MDPLNGTYPQIFVVMESPRECFSLTHVMGLLAMMENVYRFHNGNTLVRMKYVNAVGSCVKLRSG